MFDRMSLICFYAILHILAAKNLPFFRLFFPFAGAALVLLLPPLSEGTSGTNSRLSLSMCLLQGDLHVHDRGPPLPFYLPSVSCTNACTSPLLPITNFYLPSTRPKTLRNLFCLSGTSIKFLYHSDGELCSFCCFCLLLPWTLKTWLGEKKRLSLQKQLYKKWGLFSNCSSSLFLLFRCLSTPLHRTALSSRT